MSRMTADETQTCVERRAAVRKAVRNWEAAHRQADSNFASSRGDPRDCIAQLAREQGAADAQLQDDIGHARAQQTSRLLAIGKQKTGKPPATDLAALTRSLDAGNTQEIMSILGLPRRPQGGGS